MKLKQYGGMYTFILSIVLLVGTFCSCTNSKAHNEEKIPKLKFHDTNFTVWVDNQYIPTHVCKIAPGDLERRTKAMDDVVNSKLYYDTATFAYFGLKEGGADIRIFYPEKINTVKILPSSSAIVSSIQNDFVSFRLNKPENLTIEINGDYINSLHLFANPPETDIPEEKDPDVLYFGPGIHELSHLEVRDNHTLYIAEGAVIKGFVDPDESYYTKENGIRVYAPLIDIKGKNIKIKGRGIIDCENIPTHGKNTMRITGENISVEGIIIENSSAWTMPIFYSKNISIKNVKIFGHRANSDGIDICSSHNVTVDGCFLRTLDDLIVVKVLADDGRSAKDRTAGDIVVKNCVLWNQVAHALSIGAEITSDVSNVVFENCDVIHDIGREHTLRIYHTDAATVQNVKFDDIRIEESKNLISLWIGEAYWTSDTQRGNITDVTFSNISAWGDPLRIELKGNGSDSKIDKVLLKNISLNNNPLTPENVGSNEFVTNMIITP